MLKLRPRGQSKSITSTAQFTSTITTINKRKLNTKLSNSLKKTTKLKKTSQKNNNHKQKKKIQKIQKNLFSTEISPPSENISKIPCSTTFPSSYNIPQLNKPLQTHSLREKTIDEMTPNEIENLIDFAHYDDNEFQSDIGSEYENQLFNEDNYQLWVKNKFSYIFLAAFHQILYSKNIAKVPNFYSLEEKNISTFSKEKNISEKKFSEKKNISKIVDKNTVLSNRHYPITHLNKALCLQILLDHNIIIPSTSITHQTAMNYIPEELRRIKQPKINEIWQKLEQFQILDEISSTYFKPGFADPFLQFQSNGLYQTILPNENYIENLRKKYQNFNQNFQLEENEKKKLLKNFSSSEKNFQSSENFQQDSYSGYSSDHQFVDYPTNIHNIHTIVDEVYDAMVLSGGKDYINANYKIQSDEIWPFQSKDSDFSQLLPKQVYQRRGNWLIGHNNHKNHENQENNQQNNENNRKNQQNQRDNINDDNNNGLDDSDGRNGFPFPHTHSKELSSEFSLTRHFAQLKALGPEYIRDNDTHKSKSVIEEHILELEQIEANENEKNIKNNEKNIRKNEKNIKNNNNKNENFIDNFDNSEANDSDFEAEFKHLNHLFADYHRYDIRLGWKMESKEQSDLLEKIKLYKPNTKIEIIEEQNFEEEKKNFEKKFSDEKKDTFDKNQNTTSPITVFSLTRQELSQFRILVKRQLLQYLFDLTFLYQPQVHHSAFNMTFVPKKIQNFYQIFFSLQKKENFDSDNFFQNQFSSSDLIDIRSDIFISPALQSLSKTIQSGGGDRWVNGVYDKHTHELLWSDLQRRTRQHLILTPPLIDPTPINSYENSTKLNTSLNNTHDNHSTIDINDDINEEKKDRSQKQEKNEKKQEKNIEKKKDEPKKQENVMKNSQKSGIYLLSQIKDSIEMNTLNQFIYPVLNDDELEMIITQSNHKINQNNQKNEKNENEKKISQDEKSKEEKIEEEKKNFENEKQLPESLLLNLKQNNTKTFNTITIHQQPSFLKPTGNPLRIPLAKNEQLDLKLDLKTDPKDPKSDRKLDPKDPKSDLKNSKNGQSDLKLSDPNSDPNNEQLDPKFASLLQNLSPNLRDPFQHPLLQDLPQNTSKFKRSQIILPHIINTPFIHQFDQLYESRHPKQDQQRLIHQSNQQDQNENQSQKQENGEQNEKLFNKENGEQNEKKLSNHSSIRYTLPTTLNISYLPLIMMTTTATTTTGIGQAEAAVEDVQEMERIKVKVTKIIQDLFKNHHNSNNNDNNNTHTHPHYSNNSDNNNNTHHTSPNIIIPILRTALVTYYSPHLAHYFQLKSPFLFHSFINDAGSSVPSSIGSLVPSVGSSVSKASSGLAPGFDGFHQSVDGDRFDGGWYSLLPRHEWEILACTIGLSILQYVYDEKWIENEQKRQIFFKKKSSSQSQSSQMSSQFPQSSSSQSQSLQSSHPSHNDTTTILTNIAQTNTINTTDTVAQIIEYKHVLLSNQAEMDSNIKFLLKIFRPYLPQL